MSTKNILLVDDDAGVNFLNKFLLKDSKLDAMISVAMNGREALDMINKSGECPDVVFLDINMPVMDGLSFLDNFKDQPCYTKTKVYILTSSLQDSDRSRAMQHTCVVDYLEKPLSEPVIRNLFF